MCDGECRVRFTYSKRGRACFVSHVVIPQVFYRALRRAGLSPLMSRGFSPHPRITLGPALPVGIVGICEPAEIWFGNSIGPLPAKINPYLPEGFHIWNSADAEGPSLNKQCNAASYLIMPRDSRKTKLVGDALSCSAPFRELLLDCSIEESSIFLVISNPSGLGPGAMVKYLQSEGILQKWSEICLVRTMVGKWTGSSIQPMV